MKMRKRLDCIGLLSVMEVTGRLEYGKDMLSFLLEDHSAACGKWIEGAKYEANRTERSSKSSGAMWWLGLEIEIRGQIQNIL